MTTKDEMFAAGVSLAEKFCAANSILMPTLRRLDPTERNYNIGTCAYYRPTTIHIMVEKCANRGFGGRAWSWPGYAIDRTPYGVVQHELGHHVDWLRGLFAKKIWDRSREKPLTGYLGTDKKPGTFESEWFAEHFRLFVTNPGLSKALRPRFYAAMIEQGIQPISREGWELALRETLAPDRIVDQARKKIESV